jgi:hypothetical protein
MPPELAQYKALWEHLQTNTMNNISDSKGAISGRNTLHEYLTEDNGVTWHQDQNTITVEYANEDTRNVNAEALLNSWGAIIQAIPNWCLDLIKNLVFTQTI